MVCECEALPFEMSLMTLATRQATSENKDCFLGPLYARLNHVVRARFCLSAFEI